jgi:hypothetical protein
MKVLTYIAWGVAFFFAGTWTLGVLFNKVHALKSTVATLIYWWAIIGLAFFGLFNPLHFFWLMPLALLLPGAAMQVDLARRMTTSMASILVKSGFVIAPAVGVLIYFSR